MSTWIVITSINKPTKSVIKFNEIAKKKKLNLLVIGDTKTPEDYFLEGVQFLSYKKQLELYPSICSLLPTAHYSRKNIGYIHAIKNGATIIHDTDDDNIPYDNWDLLENTLVKSNLLLSNNENNKTYEWANIYKYFSESFIWPRGLPLENIHANNIHLESTLSSSVSPIHQYLADGNPDVDGIYRLLYNDINDFRFNIIGTIAISKNIFVPFNSQNTTFFNTVCPLLYLPSYVSFRMTDIWRSFIAQRILWEINCKLSFHKATVFQERNDHNLLKDFEQEIPGYLNNNKICQILYSLNLSGISINEMLYKCYYELCENNLIDKKELLILKDFIYTLPN